MTQNINVLVLIKYKLIEYRAVVIEGSCVSSHFSLFILPLQFSCILSAEASAC